MNILMEFSPSFSSRFVTMSEAKIEFTKIQASGFKPFKLFSPHIKKENWYSSEYLKSAGLLLPRSLHPIMGDLEREDNDSTTVMWEVKDWDLFFTVACPVGCNIWWHRM
jgi:hypothetical protein